MSANHLDVVQQVKAELEAQGVNLSGACGAFAILTRVANVLNAGQPLDDHQRPPWGLLRKAGGNRAIPQSGGGCLDGDHGSGDGYATDYLIERGTWFGYDILGDGGGANNPQWPDDPETDPEMVKRNRENFRPPVPDASAPTPTPVPTPAPTPTPTPTPSPDLSALTAKVQLLEGELTEAHDAITVLEAKVKTLEQGPSGDIKDLIKRVVALEARKVPVGVTASARIFGTNIPISAKLSY